jgi:hypothetical protein
VKVLSCKTYSEIKFEGHFLLVVVRETILMCREEVDHFFYCRFNVTVILIFLSKFKNKPPALHIFLKRLLKMSKLIFQQFSEEMPSSHIEEAWIRADRVYKVCFAFLTFFLNLHFKRVDWRSFYINFWQFFFFFFFHFLYNIFRIFWWSLKDQLDLYYLLFCAFEFATNSLFIFDQQ